MEGWISIHRKIMKWEWYTDNVVKSLFIHCLLKANHTTKKWRGITIKRGQFITSLGMLSSETGLSVKQIRRGLDALELTGELGKETTKINTCITVTYYDDYQKEGKEKTLKGQTKGKEGATTNNDNNVNNELKNNKPQLSVEETFNLFWDHFHKITGKKKTDIAAAKKKWKAINLKERQEAYQNVRLWFNSIKNKGEDLEFVKKARTYLEDKSFLDEFKNTSQPQKTVYKGILSNIKRETT